MTALTRCLRAMLDCIEKFYDANGYSPTLEEIGKLLGLKSLATVHKHLKNLEKKGCIRRPFNSSRSIELLKEAPVGPRFRFRGPDRLWDTVEGVFWVKEKA